MWLSDVDTVGEDGKFLDFVTDFKGQCVKSFEKNILKKSLAERDGRVYFEINPHITLSKFFDESGLENLTKFGEEIVFDTFSWTQEK